MTFSVNYAGEEENFNDIMKALFFMNSLKPEGIGSDLWYVDESGEEVLIRSQYKNHLTGRWIVWTAKAGEVELIS